jgi:hypothetical protein
MAAPTIGFSRREVHVPCPSCNHSCLLPPSAIARNQFFCSSCGKQLDLKAIFRQLAADNANGAPQVGARRERESKYKSARKARR